MREQGIRKSPLATRALAVAMAFAVLLPPAIPAALAQTAAAPTADQQAMDKLLSPVALYPDALLAQVLTSATSPQQVTEIQKWLQQNQNLQGTELQEAASKKGFDASFVALVLFPDVIDMMAKNMDWTTEIGKAFLSDQKGVMASVQRLRAQAQAMGNLKSTQQQTVTTETKDGTTVIVVQPANPQVVYVPVYTQTVYTTPAPAQTTTTASSDSGKTAAVLMAFALGVAVGAAASNDYYYGYWGMGWHTHVVVVRGGYWRVPPHARYPYTRPVPYRSYHPRSNIYAPTHVNVNVNRNNVNVDRGRTQRPSTRPAAPSTQPVNRQQPGTRPQATPASSRGFGQAASGAPSNTAARTGTKSGAFSGYENGKKEKAASTRGRKSASGSKGRRSR